VLALSDAAGRQLRWVVVWSMMLPLGAELRDGDDVFVSIRSHLNQRMDATTARHHWKLWKVGFLRPKILIDPEGNRDSALVFAIRAWKGGGLFEPRPGVVLDLRRTNVLGSAWEWRDGMETPIVKFGAGVTIRPDAFSYPDLDLLVVVGYFVSSLAASGGG